MNNRNKFLSLIWVATFVVTILGTTFSYFTSNRRSETGAVATTSGIIGAELDIASLYNNNELIPMNDADVIRGYNNQCVDINNYGACQTYNINITNHNDTLEYTGTINFTLSGIEHLNYLILDEEDNIYHDKEEIISGTDQSFGPSFELETDETKNFKLVIWVPNYEYNQNDEDAAGYFSAIISFESTLGNRITGAITEQNNG